MMKIYCKNSNQNAKRELDTLSIGGYQAILVKVIESDLFDYYVTFIRGNSLWELEIMGHPARIADADYFLRHFNPGHLRTSRLIKISVPYFKVAQPVLPDNTEHHIEFSKQRKLFSEGIPITSIVSVQSTDYTANVHFTYREAEVSPYFHTAHPKAILDTLIARNKTAYNLENLHTIYQDELTLYSSGSCSELNANVHYKAIIRDDRIADMLVIMPSDLSDSSYVQNAVINVRSSLSLEEQLSASKVSRWVGLSKKSADSDQVDHIVETFNSKNQAFNAALESSKWPIKLTRNDSLMLRSYYLETALDSNQVDLISALKIGELYAKLMPSMAISDFSSTLNSCDAAFCSEIAFNGMMTCPYPMNFEAYRKVIQQLETKNRVWSFPLPEFNQNPEFYTQRLDELAPMFAQNPDLYFLLPGQFSMMYEDSAQILSMPKEISTLLKNCLSHIANEWENTDELVRNNGLEKCLQIIHKTGKDKVYSVPLRKLLAIANPYKPTLLLTLAICGEVLTDEQWSVVFNSNEAFFALHQMNRKGLQIPDKYIPTTWKDVSLCLAKAITPSQDKAPIELFTDIQEEILDNNFRFYLYKTQEESNILCGPFPEEFDLRHIQHISAVIIPSNRNGIATDTRKQLDARKNELLEGYFDRCADELLSGKN